MYIMSALFSKLSDNWFWWLYQRVFLEGNPYLLGITMVVSLLHSVFDFLAFKNGKLFCITMFREVTPTRKSIWLEAYLWSNYFLSTQTSNFGTKINLWKDSLQRLLLSASSVSLLSSFIFLTMTPLGWFLQALELVWLLNSGKLEKPCT